MLKKISINPLLVICLFAAACAISFFLGRMTGTTNSDLRQPLAHADSVTVQNGIQTEPQYLVTYNDKYAIFVQTDASGKGVLFQGDDQAKNVNISEVKDITYIQTISYSTDLDDKTTVNWWARNVYGDSFDSSNTKILYLTVDNHRVATVYGINKETKKLVTTWSFDYAKDKYSWEIRNIHVDSIIGAKDLVLVSTYSCNECSNSDDQYSGYLIVDMATRQVIPVGRVASIITTGEHFISYETLKTASTTECDLYGQDAKCDASNKGVVEMPSGVVKRTTF